MISPLAQLAIYPDGEKIKYFYNLGGQLSSIVGEKEYLYRYIDSTGYDAYEQKVYQRMGNGAVTTYDYSKERRRLKNLIVTSPKVTGGAIMDNTYGYDVMDNIISLVNNATPQIMQNGKTIGGSITHNYEYDNWSRLVHADGKFVAGSKSATYNLTMGYDKLYNITNKKLDVTQNNLQFDGTLKAGHDFTYKYDPKDPFRLLSVDAKEYRSSTEEVDTTRREHSYAFDGNGNLVLQLSDLAERIDSASFADTAAMQVRQYLWDEDNHLLAINDNGFVSNYFYDAAGERTVKISAPDLAVFVNGAEALKNDSALVKFVGYVSPYLVVSNGGRYTKHIYAGTQRIASKLGDIEAFGADPRRVEYAGANLKEVDFGEIYDTQTKALMARYDSLGVEHRPNTLNDYVGGQSFCCGEKELVSNNQTGDNTFETPGYEHLIFFYHPDHLGSTSLVTDNSGNVVQSVAYIPYGEVFIEERNGTWNTPYLFNGKELDEETGLYYYGARYLNPTSGMWLSVDPLFEKYVGMSPYNYCAGNPVKLVDPDGRRSLPIDEEYNGFNARVDSWYGPRNIKNGSKNHKGLDFNYSCGGNNDYGSPIIATHDGTVNVKDNTKGGEGRMVTITSHDDKFRTRYMHLSSVDVENGTNINEGDILGYMGGSGKGKEDAYLSHLHYEIQKFENDKWISINPTEGENKLENIVDPQSWLVKPSIKSAPEPTNENLSPINHSINDRSVRSSKTNWTDYFRNMYNSINNKIYEAIFSQFQY